MIMSCDYEWHLAQYRYFKIAHRSMIYLVQILVVQQMRFSGFKAVLAFAFVEDVGLKLPTCAVFR